MCLGVCRCAWGCCTRRRGFVCGRVFLCVYVFLFMISCLALIALVGRVWLVLIRYLLSRLDCLSRAVVACSRSRGRGVVHSVCIAFS